MKVDLTLTIHTDRRKPYAIETHTITTTGKFTEEDVLRDIIGIAYETICKIEATPEDEKFATPEEEFYLWKTGKCKTMEFDEGLTRFFAKHRNEYYIIMQEKENGKIYFIKVLAQKSL